MKISILVMLVSILALTLAYSDTDTKVDYGKLTPEQLNHALDCYLDRGPCDDSESHYKIHIMEAMKNDCAQCTDFHRHNGHMFFRRLEKINPKGLEEFKQKYSPAPGQFDEVEQILDHY